MTNINVKTTPTNNQTTELPQEMLRLQEQVLTSLEALSAEDDANEITVSHAITVHHAMDKQATLESDANKQQIAISTKAQQYQQSLLQLHQMQEKLAEDISRAVEPASQQLGLIEHTNVKQQVVDGLAYQLGATMISSKSLLAVLLLPFKLIKVYFTCRKRPTFDMPDELLRQTLRYKQVLEVKRLQQHLSYRLGNVLINGIKSPKGWVTLPSALIKESRKFKQQSK